MRTYAPEGASCPCNHVFGTYQRVAHSARTARTLFGAKYGVILWKNHLDPEYSGYALRST